MSAPESAPGSRPQSSSLRQEVHALLEESLLVDIPTSDTDLFETGLLDSLGLVDLLVQLEERYGLTISADLNVDDYRSVDAISEYVARYATTSHDMEQR